MEEEKQKRIADLEKHEQELKVEMKKAERKHIPCLLLFHFSNLLISFGKKGILLFSDGLLTAAVRIAFRFLLILILLAIKQDALFVVGGFIVTHLFSWGIGTLLLKLAVKLLEDLDIDASCVFAAYLLNRYNLYEIDRDTVTYNDGIIVRHNEICAQMRQECEEICIYCKDEPDDYGIYSRRMYDHEDQGVILEKHIASTQFNKKFGIIVEKGKEIGALGFLSPSLQVHMIRTPEMRAFKQMRIADGMFTAIIGETIPFPPGVDVYRWRPLTKHMKEIDKYCSKIRKRADEAHANMVKIDFIRGK